MWIVGVIIIGFVAGGLARLALPGPDPMPWYATLGLGIGGAVVGGIIFGILFGTGGGLIAAVVGAMILLYLYRRFVEHRPLTGPGARRPRA
jgi:uncharacterized membrane protein YeaQ/YmgE (transglycosylase-associated protein family)